MKRAELSNTEVGSTRLSSKGQLILPKAIRDARALRPGTEFTVEVTSDGILLQTVYQFAESDLDQVAGCLRVKGPAKTLAQMDSAISSEAARRNDSGRY